MDFPMNDFPMDIMDIQPTIQRNSLDKYFLVPYGTYRFVYQPNLSKTLNDPGVQEEILRLPRENALGMILMAYTLFPCTQECQSHFEVYLGNELLNPAAIWSNNPEYTVAGLPFGTEWKENWVAFLFTLSRDPAKQYTILVKGKNDHILFQFDSLEFYQGLIKVLTWFRLHPGDYLSQFHDYNELVVI